MFPNPQAALPLPSHPHLEHYRKLAKDLVKACEGDAIAGWAARWTGGLGVPRAAREVEDLARRTMAGRCALAGAQFVLARSHGFPSWPAFVKHLRAPHSPFEQAADAIVAGDAPELARLLREFPQLVRERSAREHRATLLHYVSANGVEGYRQKTPQNIVEIARMLLDAGAEVDAEADVYGAGCTALGLAATSVHPEAAGVQTELLDVLLEHGADPDARGVAGARHSLIVACFANGRPRAAEHLAARGAQLDLPAAAGVGRLDVVQRLAPAASHEQLAAALRFACEYGRRDVVAFLVGRGAALQAPDDEGETPLHHAAMGGQAEIIALLLQHGAELETRNRYGGTVLGQAMWSAAHSGDPAAYADAIEVLIAAGAALPERFPPIHETIDALLERHGSRADPSLKRPGGETE